MAGQPRVPLRSTLGYGSRRRFAAEEIGGFEPLPAVRSLVRGRLARRLRSGL